MAGVIRCGKLSRWLAVRFGPGALKLKIMKLQNKAFLCLLAFFLIILIFLHLFVNSAGKYILSDKLSSALKREVKIGSVKAGLLFGIIIKDIEVKDLLKIKQAYTASGALDMLRKKFILSNLELKDVQINIEKPLKLIAPPEALAVVAVLAGQAAAPAVPESNRLGFSGEEPLFSDFRLKRLKIYNATVNFIDKSIPEKEVIITAKDLDVTVENFNFANSIAFFKLDGKIPWADGKEQGKIEVDGWFNPAQRDMQASVKVEGIDGVALYPYYAKWVDLEKARIEKAKLNFFSEINGLNNDLTALCRVELSDIVRRPRAVEEAQDKEKAERIADVVLDAFKTLDQGKIMLEFQVKTKMDKPEFGFSDIRNAFESKLNKARSSSGFKPEDIFMFPGKLIEGTVRSAAGISKAMIESTVAVGTELKKAVNDTFKKETKPQEKKP